MATYYKGDGTTVTIPDTGSVDTTQIVDEAVTTDKLASEVTTVLDAVVTNTTNIATNTTNIATNTTNIATNTSNIETLLDYSLYTTDIDLTEGTSSSVLRIILDGGSYYLTGSYAEATTSTSGLMSATDKSNLDALVSGGSTSSVTVEVSDETLVITTGS